MSFLGYITKSFAYYRKNNIAVVLGAAVATAVLVGGLIIGDSVRGSLVSIALARLQSTEYVLQTQDRYFTPQLADRIAADLNNQTSSVLLVEGMVVVSGGQQRANRVQVIGYDDNFFALADKTPVIELASNEILINTALANRLNLQVDQQVLVRLNRPQVMPLEAPMAQEEYASAGKRFTIKHVLSDAEFGAFNLQTNQTAPLNIFIPIHALHDLVEIQNIANVLLVDNAAELLAVENSLQKNFTLADASLHLKAEPVPQLISDRIFLDPFLATSIQQNLQPVLTYLINDISFKNNSTPYSFVTGLQNDLEDNEIIINSWLATDLGARIGDTIQLNYFTLGKAKKLIDTQSEFIVRAILPMQHPSFRADLMPAFPGLEQENCRDWESGFPIDYDKIRDKDEDYWDDFRGTPKALISYKAAKTLWGNRFGQATALEFPGQDVDDLQLKIQATLTPDQFGFVFQPVKQHAIDSATQATDFSELFLGLSFFIIIAALILTGLLFVFYTEKRRSEIALLRALGYSRSHVYKLVLGEGVLLAVTGGLIGIPLGIFYNQFVLFLLQTVWNDIIRTGNIHLVLKLGTIFIGFAVGFIFSLASLIFTIRKSIQTHYTKLKSPSIRHTRAHSALVLALVCFVLVMAILLISNPARDRNAVSIFFSAGFLLLLGGFSLFYYFFSGKRKKTSVSLFSAGFQNLNRNLKKNISVIAILALGVFLVFMVGSNKTNVVKNAHERSSGTGGFSFFASTTIPVLNDLNDKTIQQQFDLAEFDSIAFVPFYVKKGDEASCLNLNQISQPQLVATDPQNLDSRNAFTFTTFMDSVDPEHPWLYLDEKMGNAIPAFADETVLTWSLMKSVGDTLFYIAENGNEIPVILAGGLASSIFQGNLILSEKNLLDLYPSTSGYNIFMIDSPNAIVNNLADKLGWALQDYGISIELTVDRLAEFAKITNTYLSIFLILGGLGLLLGTLGIGLMLMRTIFERQSEFGIMQALGFTRQHLMRMILAEYVPLLLAGVILGAGSAIIAALPALTTPGADIPWLVIVVIFTLLVGVGVIWVRWAAIFNLKQNLIESIRTE